MNADVYLTMFNFLPQASCLVCSDKLTIININEKFKEIFNITLFEIDGQSFVSKILNLNGKVDFEVSLQQMKAQNLRHHFAEEIETLILSENQSRKLKSN